MGKWKKLKKTAKKVDKAVDNTVGRYASKGYNKATGAIEKGLDEAVEYADDEFDAAVDWAVETYEKGTDWMAKLADDAIDAAYKALYQQYVEEYVEFVYELGETAYEIFLQPDNVLTTIGESLLDGDFPQAQRSINSLLGSSVMKPTLELGHKLFGTCFVIAADVGYGAGAGQVSLSGSTNVGAAVAIDNLDKYEYACSFFTGSGFAVGLSTGDNADLSFARGISMGFLRKDPTNISGWFVDVSGGGSFKVGDFGLTLSFPPPNSKAPYVHSWKPVAGVARYAYTLSTNIASPGISGSVSAGASYTNIIQKIRT